MIKDDLDPVDCASGQINEEDEGLESDEVDDATSARQRDQNSKHNKSKSPHQSPNDRYSKMDRNHSEAELG